jgi:hypothetical protein
MVRIANPPGTMNNSNPVAATAKMILPRVRAPAAAQKKLIIILKAGMRFKAGPTIVLVGLK